MSMKHVLIVGLVSGAEVEIQFASAKAFFEKLNKGKPFAVFSKSGTPTWLNPTHIVYAQPTGERCP